MSANDEANLLNPLCTTIESQIDSTEYCARWLATISAAQHDETSSLAQERPLSESHPKYSNSENPDSPPVAASPRRVTHDRAEALAPRQATPSSAPSHIDATPEPEPVCLARIPYNRSPRAGPDETSKYERKPRRKTRPDRYDTSRQHQDKTNLSRRERRERKKEKLRSRKEIMTNFYSSAIENRHVLMKPALATGAFVNGRGSVSTPLTDLTFNELTFPITRKPAPRAASPQPPNGARRRPIEHAAKSPDEIHSHSKEPIVIEDCPDTPSPPPRRGRGARVKQMPQPHDESDGNTTPKKDVCLRNTTPRPIIRYVDSGVDTMSLAGNPGPNDVTDTRHLQHPPAGYESSEQANLHAPYYNPLPVFIPQYYDPTYSASGIYPHAGLQPSVTWAEHVPHNYPSQCLDSMPIQPGQYGYEDQNRYYDYMAQVASFYPGHDTDLDERTLASPVHEPEPPYKPDEESKAFWRPNFLR